MPGAFAVWLDGDDVGAPVPCHGRCCEVCPAVLPGADEVLKFGRGPGLFEVLNGAAGSAEEPVPAGHRQAEGYGHPAVRVVHHLFCVAGLLFDVAAVCFHQVHELALGVEWGRPARQEGGQAGGQGGARRTAGTSSHGGLFR